MTRPAVSASTQSMPRLRLIPLDRPWQWLNAGWNDLMQAPRVGLAYGAFLVVISFVISLGLYWLDMMYLVLPMAAGFMFVAPLLGIGLYETSRRLEHGQPVSFMAVSTAFLRNRSQVLLIGLLLMLFHLAWVRIAMLLVALFFQERSPRLDTLADTLFFLGSNLPFLVTGTIIGAVLAAIVFAIGAISLPMLIDRDIGAAQAVVVSVNAVRLNWKPLALWAALIVMFTAMGLAAFYLGLLIAWPLIGHASWHAYRDLVE